jgi:xanthine dehydrogenase accessory factor
LDLGAVTPAEVAVSITAEVIAVRTKVASHQPLSKTLGPIHRQPTTKPAATSVVQQEIVWT